MTAPAAGRSTKPATPPASGIRPERLAREFEDLGLGPAEARVIVALLRLGSAKSTQLAKEADVPRSGIYQLVESLQDKGLVLRVPGAGPALWTTPGRDKVLDRLHSAVVAAQQERVEQHALRTTLMREMLEEALPTPGEPNLPYVNVITCPSQLREENIRLLSQATTEVLVFNRPPYSADAGEAQAAMVQAIERGVTFRTLYQSAQADAPEAIAFRASADTFKAAGLQARVVDELPVKLLVVDRSVTILALDNPVLFDGGFPVTLLIEHPGYATLTAAQFEHLWAQGRPYGDPPADN